MTRDGRHPREELVEAALGEERSDAEALSSETLEHLETCAECRQLLADLKATRRISLSLPLGAIVTEAETETAVRQAMLAAGSLAPVGPALENVDGSGPRVAAASETPSLAEKAGFVLMALGILGIQAFLAVTLKPKGFFILEGLLNWMAPFSFYIIFRLGRRPGTRKEGA